MERAHLNDTLEKLKGPTRTQLVQWNEWAAVALSKFHTDQSADIEMIIDSQSYKFRLEWTAGESTAAMREKTDMAHFGGISLAMFVMSVIKGYTYASQSEIGSGNDYMYLKDEPDENDLNFLNLNHFIEVSGLLEESPSNTLTGRIRDKHKQLAKGSNKGKNSSVIVTLFSQPTTVKEVHE